MQSRPPIETFPYPLPLSEPSHIQHPVTGIGMTRSNRRSIMLAIIIITINAAGVSEHCRRSEEHTSELQSLMRNSYAVFCLKKKSQISSTHTCATVAYNHQVTPEWQTY